MRGNTATVGEAQYSASFSKTIAFEYYFVSWIFGVERVRSTVHNWAHKADLQQKSGRTNHVAVDETVIRLDNEQYQYITKPLS